MNICISFMFIYIYLYIYIYIHYIEYTFVKTFEKKL